MKQIKMWAILVLVCILTACGGGADIGKQVPIAVKWPVYKVEKAGNVAYIMGTIHVGEKEMYPFPKYVRDVIDSSDVLLTEINMQELKNNFETIQAMQLLPKGQVISDILSPEAFANLEKKAAEYGIPMDNLLPLKPYAIVSSFTNIMTTKTKQTGAFGVEQELLRYAQQKKIRNLGLETAEFQMELLEAEMPESIANDLMLTIPELSDALIELEQITADYRINNHEGFSEHIQKASAPLSIDRNIRWVPLIEQQLVEGKQPFVAVGFLHLLGDDGLLDLFEEAGYTVTLVAENN